MMTGQPKDFWNARFQGEGFAYGARASRLLMAFQDVLQPGMKVLVPGCGEGRDAVFLAKLGLDVHAVDISPVGLEKARKLAAAEGVSITTEETDLETWVWPEEHYHLVASIFLHTLPDRREAFHHKMLASLVPGGLIFLEGFSPDQIVFQERFDSGGPKAEEMLFDPDMIAGDFGDAIPFSFWTGTEVLDEGPLHSGPAALLRAVYRRPEN